MQLSLILVLCFGTTQAAILRGVPEVPDEVKDPKVPEVPKEVKDPKVEVPDEVKDPKAPEVPKEVKDPKVEVPEDVKDPKVPEVPKDVKDPKVPEVKEPKVPEAELKCGPLPPWSEHAPMEPNVADYESMCQACKIRACNANLPMPGEGGKACRCQYSKVGDTYTTDCKPPFAEGVKSVGDWNNCPGGVRNCEELEGQCVSATFKMDSAPEAPEPKEPKAKAHKPIGQGAHQSGKAVKQRTKDANMDCEEGNWNDCHGPGGDYANDENATPKPSGTTAMGLSSLVVLVLAMTQ